MVLKKKRRGVKKRIKKATKKRLIRKRVVKKAAKKRIQKKPPTKGPKEKVVGIVTHYFPKVKAAAIRLKAPLSLGDTVRIKGHTTDFAQAVSSLQLNCQSITTAKKGQEIGLLVGSRVRRKDIAYKA